MNGRSFCPQRGTVWWETVPSEQALSGWSTGEELILGTDKWFQDPNVTPSSGTHILKAASLEGCIQIQIIEFLLVGFQEVLEQTAHSCLNRLIGRHIVAFAKVMKYYSQYAR